MSYLIDGGAPAGIKIMPGDDGWRMKSNMIKTITIQGKSRTNPSGIEMDEFPLMRIRRRKNASLGIGSIRLFSVMRPSSEAEILGADGSLFVRCCMKPIV